MAILCNNLNTLNSNPFTCQLGHSKTNGMCIASDVQVLMELLIFVCAFRLMTCTSFLINNWDSFHENGPSHIYL